VSEEEDNNEDVAFGYSGDELQDFAKYLNRLNKKSSGNNKNKVTKNTSIYSLKSEVLEGATEETVARCMKCQAIINLNVSGSKCWRCGSQEIDYSEAKKLVNIESKNITEKNHNVTEKTISCSKCGTKITVSISGSKCWRCGYIQSESTS
jgi:hypothetical protein